MRNKILRRGTATLDWYNPERNLYHGVWLLDGKEYTWIERMYNGRIISVILWENGMRADRRFYRFSDLVKIGNNKLPDKKDKYPCMVYNTGGSAKDCSSLACGDCLVATPDGKGCYAFDDEHNYKTPLMYRRRQEMFFRYYSAEEFAQKVLEHGKDIITDLRLNESGEFRTMEDYEKVDKISMYLSYYGINTYTYTARRSLPLHEFKHFTLIGSSLAGLNGAFIASNDAKGDAKKARAKGFKSMVCPADCRKCRACPEMKSKPMIVYSQNHSNKEALNRQALRLLSNIQIH